MDASTTDEALVQAATHGDERALAVLLVRTRQAVRARVAARVPTSLRARVDPDDIVQDAHVSVFAGIGGFEYQGPGSFERWVATIALHELRDAIRAATAVRRGGRYRFVSAVPPEDSLVGLVDLATGNETAPSRIIRRAEAAAAAQEAVDALPEHYRRAVWLVYVQGRSVAEAAAEMGRSQRSIHGLCRRGLQLLREQLGSRSHYSVV